MERGRSRAHPSHPYGVGSPKRLVCCGLLCGAVGFVWEGGVGECLRFTAKPHSLVCTYKTRFDTSCGDASALCLTYTSVIACWQLLGLAIAQHDVHHLWGLSL